MADQNQVQNSEAEKQAAADAAAEEQRKADEAAAEAAKQKEIEESVAAVATIKVALDSEYADYCDCDTAIVGTANGEYVLTANPIEVPQTDAENVLVSPAAKEIK